MKFALVLIAREELFLLSMKQTHHISLKQTGGLRKTEDCKFIYFKVLSVLVFAYDLILMGTIVFKAIQLSKQAEILLLSFLFYDDI